MYEWQSLTLVAIERDHIHLMGCLLEKLVHEMVFDSINDESVEALLYIGLDVTSYSACSPQSKPSVRYRKSIASAMPL